MEFKQSLPFSKDNYFINILEQIDKKIQEELVLKTPMIYKGNSSRTREKEGVATALYVAYEGKEYILTVAHTFQEHSLSSLFLDIVNIPLSDFKMGAIIFPSQNKNYKENDYCILFVDEIMQPRLKAFFQPIPIHPDAKKCRIIEENYFVLGYPATKNYEWVPFEEKTKPKTFRYCLRLPLDKNQPYPQTIFDPKKNIALGFKKRVISTENISKGIRWEPPRLNGMSGCGIWAISHYPLDVDAKSYMLINEQRIEVPHDMFPGPSISLQGMLTNYDKMKQKIIGFLIQDIIAAIEHVNSCSCVMQASTIVTSKECPELYF